MTEPLTERTVVIGNSGSGKSTLAKIVADLAHIQAIDLDLLHWEEGSYGAKRNEDVTRKMVLDIADQPRWIIEGVFGWLAEVALPKATALIWLDLPWSVCRAGLIARGLRRGATNHDAAELRSGRKPIGLGRHRPPLRAILRCSKISPAPSCGWRAENKLPVSSRIYVPTRLIRTYGPSTTWQG